MQPFFGNQQPHMIQMQTQNPQMHTQAQQAFSGMPSAPQQQVPAPYVPRPPAVVVFYLPREANGYLSENYYSPFTTASGKDFISIGHYLAYRKAQECGDFETADKILAVKVDHDNTTPQIEDQALLLISQLAAQIKNPDEQKWLSLLQKYLREAIVYKFVQQPEMLKALMFTADDFFLYANPNDKILGVGMDAATAAANPALINQTGYNLLGKTLLEVRTSLRAEGIPSWAYGGDKPSSKREEPKALPADSKPDTGAVDIAALLNQVQAQPAAPPATIEQPPQLTEAVVIPPIEGMQVTLGNSDSESSSAEETAPATTNA